MSKQTNIYVHGSDDQREIRRLELFNDIYGPKTHQVLSSYVNPGMKVLELGVGLGIDGAWFAEKVGCDGVYVGLDRDPAQVARSQQRMAGIAQAHIVQTDLYHLAESEVFQQEKPENGFDLIFCRWVLSHIPVSHLPKLIEEITGLLAVGGIFICEEADFRTMCLLKNSEIVPNEAVSRWLALADTLFNKKLKTNCMMDGPELLHQFAHLNGKNYKTEILDASLPEITGGEKQGLVYVLQTAKQVMVDVGAVSSEEMDKLTKDFEKIAADPELSIVFYRNTFAKTQRLK